MRWRSSNGNWYSRGTLMKVFGVVVWTPSAGLLMLIRHQECRTKYFQALPLSANLAAIWTGVSAPQASTTLRSKLQTPISFYAEIPFRKSLGRPHRPHAGEWPDAASHWHPSHPRGDEPAGVRDVARSR